MRFYLVTFMTAAALTGLVPAAAVAQENDVVSQPPKWNPERELGGDWVAAPPPVRNAVPSKQAVRPGAHPTLASIEMDLAPYGTWFDAPGLGRVWQPSPALVGNGFTPYSTDGTWVYTPSGWVFESSDPFGPLTYHYGRWYLADDYGWVWWPTTTWAPSWVQWRVNDDYVAWSPLPPPGFELGFAVEAPGWSFAPFEYFGRPSLRYNIFYMHRAPYGHGQQWVWNRRRTPRRDALWHRSVRRRVPALPQPWISSRPAPPPVRHVTPAPAYRRRPAPPPAVRRPAPRPPTARPAPPPYRRRRGARSGYHRGPARGFAPSRRAPRRR